MHQLLDDIQFYDEIPHTNNNQASTTSSTKEYTSPFISEPRNAWDVYNEKAKQEDSDMVHTLNGTMDALLVFVSFPSFLSYYIVTYMSTLGRPIFRSCHGILSNYA